MNFEVVRCLVIAGPGFAKDTFKEYLMNESVKQGHKHLADHRDRFLTVAASNAYKHALKVHHLSFKPPASSFVCEGGPVRSIHCQSNPNDKGNQRNQSVGRF